MFVRKAHRFHNERGQALVELALILFLLALLFMGVFDFSRAIQAKNIITNVSREGADLASRALSGPLTEQNMMNTLAYTAQPLDMGIHGMMYITVVNVPVGGSPQISSQTGWRGSTLGSSPGSKLGTPVSPSTTGLASLGLSSGQNATIVEVFYNYESLFSNSFIPLAPQLYSISIFSS
jgi:Flp pilus assembly protein TadG